MRNIQINLYFCPCFNVALSVTISSAAVYLIYRDENARSNDNKNQKSYKQSSIELAY